MDSNIVRHLEGALKACKRENAGNDLTRKVLAVLTDAQVWNNVQQQKSLSSS